MDPALHPQDLGRLITDFTERVPGVLHAVVVTSDGVPVAVSDRIQPGQLEQLSAITAGLISLAWAAARISDTGAVTQALVTMERGTLVIMAIDGRSHLAVLTTAPADLEIVAYEMTMLVEQAGSIFTPRPRVSAVPDDLSAVGDAPSSGQDRQEAEPQERGILESGGPAGAGGRGSGGERPSR